MGSHPGCGDSGDWQWGRGLDSQPKYTYMYTVEYVSSAHHVVSAHPPLQRQLPARGTFIHVVSTHSNALQAHDAK